MTTASKNYTLYHLRIDAGLTQAEAAAKIGVHRITYSRWESGTNVIPPRKYKAFVAAVGELVSRVAAVESSRPPPPKAAPLKEGPTPAYERPECDPASYDAEGIYEKAPNSVFRVEDRRDKVGGASQVTYSSREHALVSREYERALPAYKRMGKEVQTQILAASKAAGAAPGATKHASTWTFVFATREAEEGGGLV